MRCDRLFYVQPAAGGALDRTTIACTFAMRVLIVFFYAQPAAGGALDRTTIVCTFASHVLIVLCAHGPPQAELLIVPQSRALLQGPF